MRKSEYLPFIFMIAMLILETTAIPATVTIETWRNTGRGKDADTLQNGLISGWTIFFIILIFGTAYNYIKVYGRCVGLSRINLVLTDRRGPEYFEGVGITKNYTYQTAAVDISRYLEDHELVDVFNRFVRDRMSKYPGLDLKVKEDGVNMIDKVKSYFDNRKSSNGQIQNPGDEIIKKRLTVENIDERNIRWQGYELEYFMQHDFENYFSPEVLDWLALQGVNNRDDLIKKRDYDLFALQELFKASKVEIAQGEKVDLVKTRAWMSAPFDYFDKEEIKFLKSKQIMTFGDLLGTNLQRLDREFNQFLKKIPTGSKIAIKWAKFKEKLKIDYVPLRREVERLKKEVIAYEKDFLIEFSKNKFDNFLDVRIAKVRSLYYQYFLEYIEIDEPIMFAVERMTQDEKPSDGETPNIMPLVPIKRFLMILPDSFGNSLHFRPKRILFEGYDISCPKVAEAEVVFHSIIVHNIALLYCNSCDYTRNSIMEDFHVDIDKFHEVVQAGLVNVIDELDASLDKLRVKIANRDKRINAFKETEDDKFEQWGADLDKTNNPIREVRVPSRVNYFVVLISILCLVMGLVIGLFLGKLIP